MAFTQLHPSPVDSFWVRAGARSNDLDARAARKAARDWDARHGRRQRTVKALGVAAIFGLGAFTAWAATSTQVRDEIATWGTMGKLTPAHLTESAPENVAQSMPDLDLGTETLAWAVAPPLAESSRDVGETGTFENVEIDDSTWVAPTSAGATTSPANDPYGNGDLAPTGDPPSGAAAPSDP